MMLRTFGVIILAVTVANVTSSTIFGPRNLHVEMDPSLGECSYPLGIENKDIPDAQITASTEFNAAHGASNGRLNFKAGGGKTGAWSAGTNDTYQWLQVDLGQRMKLTGIQTQGRSDVSEWVTSYTVSFSDDGTTFTAYKQNAVLQGNSDRNAVVWHFLSPSIIARYIRVHPKSWYKHISMRTELLGCLLECSDPLGMENKDIPDAQITASSEYNSSTHGASNGRLNFQAGGGKTGAWSAEYNNVHQWLQVDLGQRTRVTGIKTQGRSDKCEWVTSYSVSYSDDGTTFTSYKHKTVLQGNDDRDTVVFHVFSPPINARYIRVHPKTWSYDISMRMELLGCSPATPTLTTSAVSTTTEPPTTTPQPTTTEPPTTTRPPAVCSDALGMENKDIPDAQITASSEYNAGHGASNGRLNFKPGGGKTGAWSAGANDGKQWLQVDLGQSTKVTGIKTQGRQDADQWVTTYTVSYSNDGTTFTSYKQNAVLQGNKDRNTVVLHVLSAPINARFVRLHPKTYHGYTSMRMELLGCPSV